MKNTVLTYKETSLESPFFQGFNLELEAVETDNNYSNESIYQSPFQQILYENDVEKHNNYNESDSTTINDIYETEENLLSHEAIEEIAKDDFQDLDYEDEIEFEELYDDELEQQLLQEYESATDKEPMPIPVSRPVPFASPPPLGSYWPLISTHRRNKEVAFQYLDKPNKYVGNRSRSFLARRSNGKRYHVGIDLYANHKDKVVACEDGVIIKFYGFYRSTFALIVEHENVVINYGEVHKDSLKANRLKVGDRVSAGQIIGFAGKMFRSSMLHFEIYRKGTNHNLRWLIKNNAPHNLINPTKYLLFLQEHGKIANSRNINPHGVESSGTTDNGRSSRGNTINKGKDTISDF
jgi:murein DD-endopeptidase MepM/ murein hydrolase activator NlpD